MNANVYVPGVLQLPQELPLPPPSSPAPLSFPSSIFLQSPHRPNLARFRRLLVLFVYSGACSVCYSACDRSSPCAALLCCRGFRLPSHIAPLFLAITACAWC